MAEQLQWRKWSERQCYTCRQWIDTEVVTGSWHNNICPDCRRQYHQDYNRANAEQRAFTNLKYYYGVTKAEWLGLWHKQGGLCALCDRVISKIPDNNTHTDHNHLTRKVRGILCPECNRGMSFLDRPGWLERALQYKEASDG